MTQMTYPRLLNYKKWFFQWYLNCHFSHRLGTMQICDPVEEQIFDYPKIDRDHSGHSGHLQQP